EDVVLVRLITTTLDRLALLGERGLLGDVGVLRMQVVQVLRHHRTLCIAPRTLADAIARAHAGVAARHSGAEVRLPVRVLRARGLGERVAVRVGALEAAE